MKFLLQKDNDIMNSQTHKTTPLQTPPYKPMHQLAKELFSCQRSPGNLVSCGL